MAFLHARGNVEFYSQVSVRALFDERVAVFFFASGIECKDTFPFGLHSFPYLCVHFIVCKRSPTVHVKRLAVILVIFW